MRQTVVGCLRALVELLWRARRARAAVLAGGVAAIVLFWLPSLASATSVVYIDGGNVWTARVDGTHKAQFTTDGTKTEPAWTDPSANGTYVGAYSNVTADDSGRVLVARKWRAADGQSESPFWIWSDAAGKQLALPAIVKMSFCGMSSVGPAGARLHPSGTWFVFWYICNYGALGGFESTIYVQVSTPGSVLQGPEWPDYFDPSWYGNRVTASNQYDAGIQADDPNAPAVANLSFDLWVAHSGNDRITQIEPARSGGLAIIEHYDSSVSPLEGELTFVTFSGAPQLGDTVEGCTIPTVGDAMSPSWSADGKWVAWSDDGGVKSAAVPANLTTPGPCQMTPNVASATGNQSSLTPYDWGSSTTTTTTTPAPVLTHFAESSRTWRMNNALPNVSTTAVRPPVGTTFSYVVNVQAAVTFMFTQKIPGRRVGGGCVAQTKKNARKPRCTRTVSVGSFAVSAHAGANKVRFAGRLSRTNKLQPGSYTVTVIAADASQRRSAPQALTFTIVR